MTLIAINDNGERHEYNDVVAFDFLDKDDVYKVAKDIGKLDDKQFAQVVQNISAAKHFPTSDDLWYIIKAITLKGEVA